MRPHRLMAGRGQLEDRQAPVAEGHATVALQPDAMIVGPAMCQRLRHEPTYFIRLPQTSIDESGYPAHRLLSARRPRVDVLVATSPRNSQPLALQTEHAPPLKSETPQFSVDRRR